MSAGVDTGANVDTAAATISIYKTSLDQVTLDRARRLLEGLGYLSILGAYQLPEYEFEDLSVRYLLMYSSLGTAMARNVYLSGGMRADTLARYGKLTPEFAQAAMLLAKYEAAGIAKVRSLAVVQKFSLASIAEIQRILQTWTGEHWTAKPREFGVMYAASGHARSTVPQIISWPAVRSLVLSARDQLAYVDEVRARDGLEALYECSMCRQLNTRGRRCSVCGRQSRKGFTHA